MAMSTPEEIFAAVQSLELSDRWQLVSRLWNALPPEAWEGPTDEEVAEWDRRYAEIERGQVEAVPIEQVREYLRSRIERNG
jgi:putative addiction module component (TIGR02574 family)